MDETLRPLIVEPPTVGPILAVAAHPDDIESWCGGTLARAADAGLDVRLLLVTSGDKGSDDPRARPPEVAVRREREATQAARCLGIGEVDFLRHPDGEVEDSGTLRGQLVAAIRRSKPAVVFTHDPERPLPPYLAHRDHRVVGRAVLDAVYPLARDPLNFPEHALAGLGPHRVRQAWLFASAAADRYVDITASFARKVDARLAHESQTADSARLRVAWAERAAAVGAETGLGLAEAFTVLDLD